VEDDDINQGSNSIQHIISQEPEANQCEANLGNEITHSSALRVSFGNLNAKVQSVETALCWKLCSGAPTANKTAITIIEQSSKRGDGKNCQSNNIYCVMNRFMAKTVERQ